jgi:ribosome biogenesis protein MAK21
MKALENLIALAKKKNRDQAVNVLAALKDLLGQGELLPSQRRLKAFSAQPPLLEALQHKTASAWKPGQPLPGQLEDVHLVFWAYEDWLKAKYFEIIRILEAWCNDEVSFVRARCLGYVYDLLTHKPEQEANLLRLLVNKLGDVDKKIASKASLLLLQLQSAHPLMKPIVISTIESDVIFRPRQNPHAQYYAIITLNQTVLSGKEELVAVKLLEIYFALFTTLLSARTEKDLPEPGKSSKIEEPQKAGGKVRRKGLTTRAKPKKVQASSGAEEEAREKMISAILTGVNRAFPYAGKDESM